MRFASTMIAGAGVAYALFAVACFRLAVVDEHGVGLSLGEGACALLGAAALVAAALRRSGRALLVMLGTLPLVGWFAATPWNSGRPYLLASVVVPALAAAALVHDAARHRRARR